MLKVELFYSNGNTEILPDYKDAFEFDGPAMVARGVDSIVFYMNDGIRATVYLKS
jgi:hypothetical protein